jgi:HemY protein
MLFRLILLLILSGLVAAATLWLVANPGAISIDWMGWQVETTMLVLLLFLLALFLLISFTSTLFRFVFSLGKMRSRALLARRVKDQDAGLAALIGALEAASVGQIREGRRLAGQAAQLLQSRELAKLLASFMPLPPAEVGEPSLDDNAVRESVRAKEGSSWWRKLLGNGPPRPSRGRLAARHLSPADFSAPEPSPKPVKREPQDVPSEAPPAPEMLVVDTTRLTELVREENWEGAQGVIASAIPQKGKVPDAALRLKAGITLAQAMASQTADPERALALAKEAAAQHEASAFIPATLFMADILSSQGKPDEVGTLLKDACHRHPTYPLLERQVELAQGATADDRLKRIEEIVQKGFGDPQSDLALGEAACHAKVWGRARRHLIAAVKSEPSAKAYALLAQIEEQETGDATAVGRWRHKAEHAAKDYGWHCGHCKASLSAWTVLCPACSGLGDVTWGLFEKAKPTDDIPSEAELAEKQDAEAPPLAEA